MEPTRVIRLSVPGLLAYRDVAVRAVGTACVLFRSDAGPARAASLSSSESSSERKDDFWCPDFTQDEFATQVVSAFSEAYNNLAIHGYKGAPKDRCRIDLEIVADGEGIVVKLTDWGNVHDPAVYVELPDELPERGMGLFIIRSFMDEISYEAGPPNTLVLKKKWPD